MKIYTVTYIIENETHSVDVPAVGVIAAIDGAEKFLRVVASATYEITGAAIAADHPLNV